MEAHVTEGTDDRPPEWLRLAVASGGILVAIADQAIASKYQRPSERGDVHLSVLPQLALVQFADVVDLSGIANDNGRHAIGLSLVRQGVEALTIIELGLLGTERSRTLLNDWDQGRRTHGQLRPVLEAESWPSYGSGLWTESWGDFMGSLARAIQPYAHFSTQLLQWQTKMVSGIGHVPAGRLGCSQSRVAGTSILVSTNESPSSGHY